jgi:hypothetical protein
MKIKIFCLFILFAFLAGLPALVHAQDTDDYLGQRIDWGVHPTEFERIGSTGWQFLKIQADARSAAAGGVATVLSRGDALSALSNPASTADVTNIGAAVTQMTWLADIQYNAASLVKNFGQWGHVGLNVVYLDYGEMTRTDNVPEFDANDIATGVVNIDQNMGTFSGGDLAVGLSYARQVTDKLQIGGNVRYISETLDDGTDATTSNWAFDVGTVYYTGIRSLRLAMVGRNFGPDATFAEFDDRFDISPVDVRMPMDFRLGIAYDILEGGEASPHLLTVASEFSHPNDGAEKLHFGAEYVFNSMFSLRGGYRSNYDEQGLTFGGGVNLCLGETCLNLNYAYIDFGRLSSLNMFTLAFMM